MPFDWAPIVQTLAEIAVAVISGFAVVLAKQAIAAFEARTHIQLTEQQRATVLGAVQTAAGMVKLELAKGMPLAAVHVDSTALKAIAATATAGVGESIAALGVTPEGLAKMIVGKVGNEQPVTESTVGDVSVKTAAAPAQPLALVPIS